jgi:membrane-associated phospholipid phosphatase
MSGSWVVSLRRIGGNQHQGVRFRLCDIVSLAYLGVVGALILLFHTHVAAWARLAAIHALSALAVLGLVHLASRWPNHGLVGIARTFYPLVLIVYCWDELRHLVPMITGSYWATATVVRADLAVFGVHPTAWLGALGRPWLDEAMCAAFVGYYLYALLPVVLYARGKRQEALAAFSVAALCYFGNYILFLLLPAKSPPQILGQFPELHAGQFGGYAFAWLVRKLESGGSVTGAAFPSSHVAGTVATTLIALRYARPLGLALIPLTVGVAVATVYLGYHHGLDPLAGAAWGALSAWLGLRLVRARGEEPPGYPPLLWDRTPPADGRGR